MSTHPYDMLVPCSNCPFRVKGGIRGLHPQRVREIVRGPGFPCHKTVCYDDETEGGEHVRSGTSREKQCAGFLLFHERQNDQTQSMQIAERLGVYEPDKLLAANDVACVHANLKAMLRANRRGL